MTKFTPGFINLYFIFYNREPPKFLENKIIMINKVKLCRSLTLQLLLSYYKLLIITLIIDINNGDYQHKLVRFL